MATNSADDLRLNRVRLDTPRPGPTVDYHPSQDREDFRVPVVSGSVLGATSELAAILRRRLLFISLLFAVLFGIVSSMILGNHLLGTEVAPEGQLLGGGVVLASFIANALLAAILWRRNAWTLGQLRVIELLLFSGLFLNALYRSYHHLWWSETLTHVVGLINERQFSLAYHLVTSLNHDVYMPGVLLIIVYGIFVPNRWQRCALVVGLMVLVPIVLWTATYIMKGLPLDDWNNVAGTNGGFLLLIAVAIAIYGAHRIEVLRQEAYHARKLGQYQLKERLGTGGMGEVYLAEHVLLRRPCAVKLIRADRVGDLNTLRRFEREVQITATLTHSNTVQVFDYGHAEDGTFYYVMEYLPGLTLEQLVKDNGPLPPARAIHLLRQICGALQEAHAIGLIHRDIKPGNVMVCERGGVRDTVKLLDFGLVVPFGESPESDKLTQEGTITGTPAYMSPEQAGGQDEIDARSDIYSVGALAYFLLTGHSPFAGRPIVKMLAAHLYEPPAPLSAHRSEVPRELEAVILKCLAKNSDDRFHNVQSLKAALAECDRGKEWTEEDAEQWWQLQKGSEATTASKQGHDEPGPNQRMT